MSNKRIEVIEEVSQEVVEGVIEDQASFEAAIDEGRDQRHTDFTPTGKKEQAKEMYFKHASHAEIVSTLGIKKGTLLGWMGREGWADQRKENDAITLGELFEGKKLKLEAVVDMILDGSLKAIQREAKDGFKVKDLPVMLAALSSVEKLSRLTQGKATSISEERSKRATVNFTPIANTRQLPMKDPFAEATTDAPKLTINDDESTDDSTTS